MAVLGLKVYNAIPVRFNLWLMLFTSCWVVFMLRVNMSLNIIAMVPKKAHNNTLRSQCEKNDDMRNRTFHHVETPNHQVSGVTFDWSEEKQALILGSYFWSYPISSLLGGMAAERWGSRFVILITSVLSGVLTMLSPVAANWSYIALIIIRFFLGFTGGFIFPALHALVARWVPPAEKGKFISALMGGTLGTVVTWSITGPLIKRFGWESAFYVSAALTLVWCFFWWYLIADTPSDHPTITMAERKYILDSLGDKINKSKSTPPIKSIALSIPFLAMIILHTGNLWGFHFITTAGPKFVSSVLGFELNSTGAIAALPYLARLFFATIFGVIGDFILGRKLMNTTTIRKFFSLFSHVIPGVLLVLLVYAGCSTALSITLITLSLGCNGAATLTNLQNHLDLAPNYAGTLYGIANTVGSTSGFITPMITAYFTRTENGFEQWKPIFFVGASVYIASAIFFVIFGTSVTQSWNYPEKSRNEKDKTSCGNLKDIDTHIAQTKSCDDRHMKKTP